MQYNKWHSRRFWVVVWAAVLTTVIVLTNRLDFMQIALALVTIIGVWVGGESYLKKVYQDKEK